MDGLSVVGLDLSTGRSVHVRDEFPHVWRRKGHNGDGTLVCWHCYHGTDAPTETRVALVYRGGKKHGKVRAHFARGGYLSPEAAAAARDAWLAADDQERTGQAWTVRQWLRH